MRRTTRLAILPFLVAAVVAAPGARAQAAPACLNPAADMLLEPPTIHGFGYIAQHDTNGLRIEALRVHAWRAGRTGLRLCRQEAGGKLSDETGGAFEISAAMALAVERINRYFSLTPIGADANARLRAALLSEQGVAAVRKLFESSIEQRIRAGRRELVPEVHGQAALEGDVLQFRAMSNTLVALLKRLREVARDRAALTRLVENEAVAVRLLDERGAFRKFLFETLPAWEAADHPAIEKRHAMVEFHLDTMAEEAATVIARGTQKEILQLMVGHDWSGHRVGVWHTHPPTITPDGLVGESEQLRGPSEADIEVALRHGQNLTIAFVEDGFDAWDLSGMKAPEDAQAPHRLVRYRSDSWRAHFRELRRGLR